MIREITVVVPVLFVIYVIVAHGLWLRPILGWIGLYLRPLAIPSTGWRAVDHALFLNCLSTAPLMFVVNSLFFSISWSITRFVIGHSPSK